MKIFIVAGARPNFMKIFPVIQELKKTSVEFKFIHTGQHYDKEMSGFFLIDLKLSKPDISLGVGSGSHAHQTSKIMILFERICLKEKPDLVMVVGDVNSTLACALVSAKLGIPVAHIEAGLRSFDRTMPEEINRVLTDQLSDFLFTTCEDANDNLRKEGISENKIYFVGNVMIDTLVKSIETAEKSTIIDRLGLRKNGHIREYALLTLHRPSNVDEPLVLRQILGALNGLSTKVPIIFPRHPRTLKQIRKFKLDYLIDDVSAMSSVELMNKDQKVRAIPPLGYFDFLCLMSNSSLVLTDSGGIQEETTILNIPCLTLRNNTERPITVTEGTNFLVGTDPELIRSKAMDIIENGIPKKRAPMYWDGKAAKRIVNILTNQLQN
jgi:UDP-N-acetylglucosamine 2-epimerase (non-hydrolysing)